MIVTAKIDLCIDREDFTIRLHHSFSTTSSGNYRCDYCGASKSGNFIELEVDIVGCVDIVEAP